MAKLGRIEVRASDDVMEALKYIMRGCRLNKSDAAVAAIFEYARSLGWRTVEHTRVVNGEHTSLVFDERAQGWLERYPSTSVVHFHEELPFDA